MSIAVDEFWKRAIAAGLLTADRCRQLGDEFDASQDGPLPADALPLARWLVANGILTRQQAQALLASRRTEKVASTPQPQLVRPQPPPLQARAKDAAPPPRLADPGAVPKRPVDTEWIPPASNVARHGRGGRSVSFSALVSVGLALALVVAIVVAGLALSGDRSGVKGDAAAGAAAELPTDPASAPETLSSVDLQPAEPLSVASKPTAVEVDDDGKTLWSSPTAGEEPSVDFLPPGVQVLWITRLAEVLQNPEGAKTLDALGPSGQWATGELRATLGVELSEVERLIVAFYADDAGLPQAAYVAHLRTPLDARDLPSAWGTVKSEHHNSKPFLQGERWAYYLPSDEHQRVVAIAPAQAMKDMLELDGPPSLRKGFEKLLRHTDDARHFNLLVAPSYLWTDGKSLLKGNLARLRDPLAYTFDESIEAMLLSAHLGDDLFLELRAVGQADRNPTQLAQLLARRLTEAGDEIERYVASIEAHPYGRLVLNRFPRMVQLLRDYTRTGSEDRQAVLRSYLPLAAAHNLTLGTQLALQESSPAAPIAAAVKPPAKTAESAAGALEKRISLSFPRDTLEHCLELLGKEIDVEIVILGPDLQLEGITKNQSFGLDLRDRKAEEVLREVLKLANPDGKLVYVIRRQGDQKEAIFITTRSAATRRGEELPEALRRPPEKS